MRTGFSDFPIQSEFGGPETYCISQSGFRAYLHAYAAHFNVLGAAPALLTSKGADSGEAFSAKEAAVATPNKKAADIRLNTRIVSMSQDAQSGKWVLQVQDVLKPESEPELMKFDYVAVCSGQASVPRVPVFPGQDKFTGSIRHSSSLQDEEDFAVFDGKRVLCIGGGETASDVALEVSSRASKCDLSMRNPVLVLPRNLWGAHPDYTEHRSMFMCPPWLRWIVYKASLLSGFSFNNAYSRTWNGRVRWVPSYLNHLRCIFTAKYFHEALTGARSFCSSVQTTKTENFLYVLEKPGAEHKPGVKYFNEEGHVVFCDGSVQQYDEILLCTGYRPSVFSFLPEEHRESCCASDRYLAMHHPLMHGVAFIGFARGNVGSLILGFEMQARWFALLVSGKRSLPTAEEMAEEIRRCKAEKDCYNYTRASWVYANFLARHHVRCEPNGWRFFAAHPLSCLKAYCGAPSGLLYRMQGPGANIEAALRGLEATTAAWYDTPPSWVLNHPFWMAAGLACDLFWSKLPLVGHYFEPLLSRYY